MAGTTASHQRLRRSEDFRAAMRGRRRARHRLVRLVARGNGLPHNRFGFTAGKRVGPAVIRNRTKRRMREIMHRLALDEGHDIVVIAEPASVIAKFDELQAAIEQCARRMALLNGE